MAEPQDAVMPVLMKIQKELSDFRRSCEAKMNGLSEKLLEQGEKLDNIESKLVYHLGITAGHVHDIQTVQLRLKTLEERLGALEKNS